MWGQENGNVQYGCMWGLTNQVNINTIKEGKYEMPLGWISKLGNLTTY